MKSMPDSMMDFGPTREGDHINKQDNHGLINKASCFVIKHALLRKSRCLFKESMSAMAVDLLTKHSKEVS
jgi:hypothetical protein